jgi:hypothetical protein
MERKMLNTTDWTDFCLNDLFEISAGKYYYADEYENGNTPYITASAINNGIAKRINLQPDFKGNAITTGKVGCTAFYQKEAFCATSDVNIFVAEKFKMTPNIGVFITSIINFSENYKWTYGRQCRQQNSKRIIIKLPKALDVNGNPLLDKDSNYNSHGYVPDFQFMEDYMANILNVNENSSIGSTLQTKNISSNQKLETSHWQEFCLHKLFDITMGNGIDSNKTTDFDPKINYVSRDSKGNGVVGFIDKIENEEIFPAGAMTVALGGSFLGSCFIQKQPFYTAQNVAVMKEKVTLSIFTKLFISSLVRHECKVKYLAFGRELNSHIRKDFTIKLPVIQDGNGFVKDEKKVFSEDGYLPDWQLMNSIVKGLPYGDRI